RLAGVLAKPLTPAALRLAVEASRAGANAPPTAPARLRGRLAGVRVLLVEDNELNQEVARHILLRCGAQVAVAANGRAAVDLLARAAGRFDVVLMDLQMPVMNGYQATVAIRALGLAALPVVAMSANAMAEDRRRALEIGMDGHLAKPIDVEQLIATLTALLPRGAAPDAAPPAGIDLDAALQRFGGDAAALLALLKRFAQTQGDAADKVRALLADGQPELAAQLLHRVRGVAANLGAAAVAGLCARAETALRQGDAVALAGLLDELEQAMALVIDAASAAPAPAGAPPPDQEHKGHEEHERRELAPALAALLVQLEQNNLKALAQFRALRPTLERRHGERAAALAEAIETLNFGAAASLLAALLHTKDSQ
uniref:response regulator n=1 Tax=Janthinobacterium sp. TaxID=1871054 RepID=UPI00293D3391